MKVYPQKQTEMSLQKKKAIITQIENLNIIFYIIYGQFRYAKK